MDVPRRTLLASAGAVSLSALLASCAGFTGQGGSTNSKGGTKTLTFTTWGSDQEQAAYKKLIAQFESQNTGVKVKLSIVPYEQVFQNLDA
jgi:multiple sugar transport system substrate-binding protein